MHNHPSQIELYKILGHPARMKLLQRLMAGRSTLTQLGEQFEHTPAYIRHHLKILEEAGLVEFVEARPVQGGPEKYYQATRRALFIQQSVLPEIPAEKTGIYIGSMDAGVSMLSEYFTSRNYPFALVPVPLSSLDGLVALRQGLCHMSTCHLVDPQSEEYNRSFVRHLFPGQEMALIQIFRREEGLIVQPGNPLGIKSLEDLTRPDVLFVNREAGSGVRQWLDLHLNRLGVQPEQVRGYAYHVQSHGEIAKAVQMGRADAGIGIAASAREFGLDFVPLFEEPYEIAVPLSVIGCQRYAPLFEVLMSNELRTAIRSLDGYLVPQTTGAVEIVR